MVASRRKGKSACTCLLLGSSLAAFAGASHSTPSSTSSLKVFEPQATILHPFSECALLDNLVPSSGHLLHRRNFSSSSPGRNNKARYGHGAVYLGREQEILILGGQIGTQGTFVTNDVLSFNTSQDYVSAASGSDVVQNPQVVPDLSDGLPPNAWGATALTGASNFSAGRLWAIGGVTQDCQSDAPAYVLDLEAADSAWKPVQPDGTVPPRRRQARGVAVKDQDESTGDTVYVWGGIAEPYTCSLETVAYLAMDSWIIPPGLNAAAVQTTSWSLSNVQGACSTYVPPVSDYAAVLLKSADGIAYIGGQNAQGSLVPMSQTLVYNLTTQSFLIKTMGTPATPSPRMAHAAVLLKDGRILVHGGIGPSSAALNESLYILDPRSEPWTWSRGSLNKNSLPSPSLAWHTATSFGKDGAILFAYGLNTTSQETSDQLFFLTGNETAGWTFSKKNPLAPTLSYSNGQIGDSVPTASLNTKGIMQAAQQLLTNSLTRVAEGSNAQETQEAEVGALPGGNDPNGDTSDDSAAAETRSSTSMVVRTSSMQSTTASVSSSEAANASNAQSSNDQLATDTSGNRTKIVAGALGGLFALAIAGGLVGLYFRRKASAAAETGEMLSEKDGDASAPPVSELLYTRQAPRRMLSLGSTASYRSGESGGQNVRENSASRSDATGHFKPLTDDEAMQAIDEFGRLSPLKPFGHRKFATLGDARPSMSASRMASSDSLTSDDSRASVAEYPFLTSVPILSDGSHGSGNGAAGNVRPRPVTRLSHVPSGSNGIPRTLVRSQSMQTTSSRSSASTLRGRAEEYYQGEVPTERDVASTPLPAREFSIHPSMDDPFADFEEVTQISYTPSRVRDPSTLPAILRPHTPRHT